MLKKAVATAESAYLAARENCTADPELLKLERNYMDQWTKLNSHENSFTIIVDGENGGADKHFQMNRPQILRMRELRTAESARGRRAKAIGHPSRNRHGTGVDPFTVRVCKHIIASSWTEAPPHDDNANGPAKLISGISRIHLGDMFDDDDHRELCPEPTTAESASPGAGSSSHAR